MSVISIANPKGGSGKTTAAILLAGEFAHAGASVSIIDADPLQWSYRWSMMSGLPDNIDVIGGVAEDAIIDTAREADETSDVVIIDHEGTANEGMLAAAEISDLVVIPVTPDASTATMARDLAEKLYAHAEEIGRENPLEIRVLLSRFGAAFRSRNEKRVIAMIDSASLETLPTELITRSAFEGLLFSGGGIREMMPSQVNGLRRAIINAESYAANVYAALVEASEAQEAA